MGKAKVARAHVVLTNAYFSRLTCAHDTHTHHLPTQMGPHSPLLSSLHTKYREVVLVGPLFFSNQTRNMILNLKPLITQSHYIDDNHIFPYLFPYRYIMRYVYMFW